MRGTGRVFRKRGLFTLLALCVGLYVVLAVLPRRRRRAAEQATAAAPVRPQPVSEPPAEPQPSEEPAAAEQPEELAPVAAPPTAADRPLVFVGSFASEVESDEDALAADAAPVSDETLAETDEPAFEEESLSVYAASAGPPVPSSIELPPVAAIAGASTWRSASNSVAGRAPTTVAAEPGPSTAPEPMFPEPRVFGRPPAPVGEASAPKDEQGSDLPPVAAIAGGGVPRTARLLLSTTIALIVAGVVTLTAFGTTPTLDTGLSDNTHGAIYSFFNPLDPTGSGVFDAFVRISSNDPIEEGYNTSGTLEYDENNSAQFTHDFKLSGVPVVVGTCLPPETGQCLFREFQLDANQVNSDPGFWISLDEVEIYLHETANITGRPFSSVSPAVEKIYELDDVWHAGQPAEHAFKINTLLNSGSGKRDVRLLVPQEYFGGTAFDNCPYTGSGTDPTCDTFVTFYSRFGGDDFDPSGATQLFPNNGGYEEWGVALYDATKSGVKFNDLDSDGVKDAGEPGLEGWRIYVDINGDDNYDAGEPTDLTGVDGEYLIGPIPPGTFDVREVQQIGWTCSYPNPGAGTVGVVSTDCEYTETFGITGDHIDNHFGNWQTATKSGQKFHDLNANGTKDTGEPGLENWRIYVDSNGNDAYDAGEPTDLTDASGNYEITGINPGSFSVREVQQTGWTCSTPGGTGTPSTATAAACEFDEVFTSGANLTGNDFGNWQTATKAGKKFHDLNANGVNNSEPGLENWRFYVDYNGNNARDAGEPFDDTDASGNYLITNINPGTWDVREETQTGWTCSYPNPAGTPAVSSDCEYTETFTSGAAETGNDFGNWTTATKAGKKFHDLNANGVNNSEPGLESWRFYVDYNGNNARDAGEPYDDTDSSGNYLITGINPGTFDVREETQTGWTCSYPNPAGTPAVSSDCEYTETFTSGAAETGNDFGNWTTATKSGQKFEDENANGQKDSGEVGLEGWRIYVDLNGNDAYDSGEPNDLTDSSGNYQITGLNPGGPVDVREVDQAGWTCSYPNPAGTPAVSTDCEYTETFTSGAAETGNDFGNWRSAQKSGTKFEDLNADGDWDAGEPGLENWRFYVDYNGNDAFDAGEPFDDSNASGVYLITGIKPGSFDVREEFQTGWTCSYPNPSGTPAESTDCEHSETFGSGDEFTGNNFGNWRPATKAGMKFHDLNASGAKDAGEGGLVGWTIFVDYDNNGSLDSGEPSDVTDADGDYLIEGIDPGTWDVTEEQQTDWTCSYPNPAGTPSVSSDCEYTETFTSGAEETGNHFGNWTTATKAGMKFHDLNANGAKDSGEGGLEGWKIFVDYDNNGTADSGEPSDETDADGNYLIEGIVPGTWDVTEEQQTGWTCSYPNPAGTPAASSDCEYTETFQSNDDLTGNDFGNWTTATKSGQKFEDENANGQKDSGEAGLENWRIYVDLNGNNAFNAGEPNDLTDASGNYEITGINPGGPVDVREVDQTGWTCSFPNPAGTPAVSSDCEYTETFKSDDDLTGNDFGNWQSATKSGQKFHDLNANGAKDAGEGGLQNWRIYVDYDDNNAYDSGEPTDLTDASGNYEITGIAPGTFDVREVDQAGWTCSYPNPGAGPVPVSSTDCEYTETFTSGAEETGNDFGNWTTATKSGQKFEDENANGQKDSGEAGLENWRIYVDLNANDAYDSGEPFDDTDSNGDYEITGIDPGGPVDVREVFKTGWTCSYPNPAGTPAESTDCEYTETFKSDDELTGNDFGNWRPATKSGQKFEDENANGVKDSGENGLVDWRIYVDYNGNDAYDSGEPTDLTDASGNYEITDIDPGSFSVREVFQTGWHCSTPGGTGTPKIATDAACEFDEVFTSSDVKTGNDFGNWYPATKSGQKFEDENANGVKDSGENGLQGWRIYVDYNGNDAYDSGEPTDVTGTLGNYEITGIDPGSFSVREVQHSGWFCSTPGGTGTPKVASAAECEFDEVFTSSDVKTGNDFGNWYPATKSGQKFEDENANGAKDAGEGGLEGWRIYVDYNGDDNFDASEPSDLTDASGNYEITGIDPGSFSVREVFQTGWHCSTPGGTGTPKIAPAAACEFDEVFTSSDVKTGNDFGNWRPATKSGMKFHDLNANGAKDAGEGGLEGWRIYVDYNGNNDFDAGEPDDLTDASGNYEITGIDPGTYDVREVHQTGWTCSYPNPAGSPATSTDCEYTETFTSSDTKTGNNFGNWHHATKSGTKFNDENGNGVRDTGEPGLAGWEIRLITPGGTVVATDTTDASGNYEFTNVDPGINYLVCEVAQSGWNQTHPGTGADCDAVNAVYAPWGYAINLDSNEVDSGNDFGNFQPPNEGCTPGFWQGGKGATLWNTTNDPQWTAAGGAGTNPYIHTTLFNDFFTDHSALNGLTMFNLVSSGGGSTPAIKAARMLVAAYLNASFGIDFPYTTSQLVSMWNAAVAGGNSSLNNLHQVLGDANELGCPL